MEDGEENALNLNSTSTTTRIYRPSSVNSYTDDMWVYHKRAHMSVNGGQRCVGIFAEACSTGKHDGSIGYG